MGIERQKLSARMTEANAEFIAQLCERWSPVVEGVSATLNLIVGAVRRMEAAGKIDLSLDAMQRLLRGHGGQSRQQDSVMDGSSELSVGRGQHAVTDLLSASAAETGRRDDALGVRAKRPPRKFTAPRVRAVSAGEVPLVAWASPFYGARPFALVSYGGF